MTKPQKTPKHLYWLLLVVIFGCGLGLPMHAQSTASAPVSTETKSQTGESTPQSSSPSAVGPSATAPPLTAAELRQAEIEADTKKLYVLSAELRAEVAKTYKESLSLTVLKKAEEVEKLARSLKTLMNQQAAATRK